MQRPALRLSATLFAPFLLAACAGASSGYPSLLPRPIESRSDAEAAPTPVPLVADPALDRQVAELDAALSKAADDFNKAARDAEGKVAVASGTARGSEPWLNAQQALAILDVDRSATSDALSALEQLAADRGVAGNPPYPSLEAALTKARTQAQAQSDRIKMLEASLGG